MAEEQVICKELMKNSANYKARLDDVQLGDMVKDIENSHINPKHSGCAASGKPK